MNPKDIRDSLSKGDTPSSVTKTKSRRIGEAIGLAIFILIAFLLTYFSYNWIAPDFHLPKLGILKFVALSWTIYYLFGRRFPQKSDTESD